MMMNSHGVAVYCVTVYNNIKYRAVYLVFKYYLNTGNFTVFIKIFKYCQLVFVTTLLLPCTVVWWPAVECIRGHCSNAVLLSLG